MISVLMCVYKEPVSYIIQSVESIIYQTYPDIEFIIIVDDPTNTEVIRKLEEYRDKYEMISLYINEKNIGLVDSLNKGLQYCHGEYIARMDADDIAMDTRLEKQLFYLEKEQYDIAGAWFEQFDEKDSAQKIIKFDMPVENYKCKEHLRKGSCLAHPTWLVRKEVYDALHGYRNIVTCEDYDFLIRCTLSGYRMGNCPEVLLKYRVHGESISKKNNIEQTVLSGYLAQMYRKGKMVSIDQYENYKKSYRYRKEIEAKERVQKKIQRAKSEKKSAKKFLYYVTILFEINYVIQYVKNKVSGMRR